MKFLSKFVILSLGLSIICSINNKVEASPFSVLVATAFAGTGIYLHSIGENLCPVGSKECYNTNAVSRNICFGAAVLCLLYALKNTE